MQFSENKTQLWYDVAPREGFEPPREDPTRFPVARTTRLCDLGLTRAVAILRLTFTPINRQPI